MFRNKEYILTIFKEGSFSRAAEKLYVSQPSLSASVKRIEEKVGFPIFDRSTSPITLTDIGEEYIKIALEIEKNERGFEKYINDYSNLVTGKIRIGGSSMFSAFVIPALIQSFKDSYPKIEFELYEDSTKNLLHKLNLGELDIVIDNTVADENTISATEYLTENLLLAVPRSFDINKKLSQIRMSAEEIIQDKHKSKKMAVPIEAFANEPFIILNHENDTGKRAIALFKEHNISPKIIFQLDQQVTAYNVSVSGMGISFVSDTLIKSIGTSPELYFYKPEGKSMTRHIFFYSKKNYYLSLAARKFIEHSIA